MNAWVWCGDGFFLFPCFGCWGVNIDKVLKRIVMDGWVGGWIIDHYLFLWNISNSVQERIVTETMCRMAGRVRSSLVSTRYMPCAYIIASRVVPIVNTSVRVNHQEYPAQD